MQHDFEHGLRVQLSTALRERDEARALAEKWILREAASVERGIRSDADALGEVQGLQAALANANAETAHLTALRAKQDAELVSTREALAAARRSIGDMDRLFLGTLAGILTAIPGDPEQIDDWLRGRVAHAKYQYDEARKARAALGAPAAAAGCPTCGCTATKDPGVPCSDSWHDLRAEMGS